MFCLQSHQFIVQHKILKNGHTLGKKINQYHTHRFCHTLPKPKISPFKSPYLTQNYNLKYVEISSGKTYWSNQCCHLVFVNWKYTAHEKIGVKVDRFLKIVWKISNLNKSRRLIYKIRNLLPSGFEIYAIWVDCLVNKLSQIPSVNSGFICHIVVQIR